jgi:hypothetical protein
MIHHKTPPMCCLLVIISLGILSYFGYSFIVNILVEIIIDTSGFSYNVNKKYVKDPDCYDRRSEKKKIKNGTKLKLRRVPGKYQYYGYYSTTTTALLLILHLLLYSTLLYSSTPTTTTLLYSLLLVLLLLLDSLLYML